ncbi:amidohydrolase family protein [Rhizobium sp. CRIBSB]|nr:amidohydrolase family protein [Rhizobium sp. CRIBSB]
MAEQASIIRAGTVITDPSVEPGYLCNAAIYVENATIKAIDAFDVLRGKFPQADVFGNDAAIALPGLINAHDHGRGLSPLSLGIDDDLLEIWILSLLQMPALDVAQDTMLSALKQLKSGISTTVNSYYHPRNCEENLNAVLSGYAASGIRAGIVYSAMDDSVVASLLQKALAVMPAEQRPAVEAFLKQRQPFDVGRYQAVLQAYASMSNASRKWLMAGPISAHWSSDALLQTIEAAARQLGLHTQMHLLESPYQARDNGKFPPKSLLRHLEDLGVLHARLSCAHCVQMIEDDIAVMAQSGASVVHNLSSNLRLRNGLAPVVRMLRAGVNVALGLDSAALNDDADLFQEMRLVYRSHGALTAREVLAMATINGAKALGLSDQLGTIELGKRADILLLNGDRVVAPGLMAPHRLFERLVNYARPEAVHMLFIDGEPVIRDGRHPTLDEATLTATLHDMAAVERDAKSVETQTMIAEVTPYLRQLLQDVL